MLLDDGWSDVDRKNGTLRSFGADPSRFPKGLSHTVRLLKDEFGVKYVGVWQAFQGYWNGLDESGVAAASCPTAITTTANGCLIPGSRAEQPAQFWDAWDGELAEAGVDFVKVDSQSSTSVMVRGTEIGRAHV
mgnify:CR=1 FL=1